MIISNNVRKFSETLLLFYQDQKKLKDLLKKTHLLKEIWNASDELGLFVKNLGISPENKKSVVSKALDSFGFDEYVINTFCLLIDKKYFDYFYAFILSLIEDIEKQLKIKNVFITSTGPFDADQKKRFEAALSKKLESNLKFHYMVDKTLILGIQVRYDDIIEEISLSSQLDKITKKLSKFLT